MIYTLLKPILWLLFKIGLRLNVEGTENIPKDGPLVIASNHLSLLDPAGNWCGSYAQGTFYGQAGAVRAYFRRYL